MYLSIYFDNSISLCQSTDFILRQFECLQNVSVDFFIWGEQRLQNVSVST